MLPEGELLQHTGALRAMARALVGSQDAPDLVQEVALQALQRPPARPGPMRAWLGSILRHFASKQRRAQRTRARHEGQAPPAEPPWPPERLAEHRETVGRLHAAFMALPEPVRGTLQLRFFEDLTPTEIAAAMHAPLPTVKSRLQRGLQLLRERLADGSGNWRGAFTAAFGLERLAGGAGALAGEVMIMGTQLKVALVAGAVAVALAAIWLARPGEEPRQLPVAGVPGGGAPAVTAGEVRGGSQVAKTFAAVRTEALPLPVPDPADAANITGRCVDASGMAIAGAHVRLHTAGTDNAWVQHHRGVTLKEVQLEVVTGADGHFAFCFEPQLPHEYVVKAHATGRATVMAWWKHIAPRSELALGDVVLSPGTALRGRVLDTDGKALGRVSMTLGSVFMARTIEGRFAGIPYQQLRTQEDGTFACEVLLAPGVYPLWVPEQKIARGAEVSITAGGGELEHEIVVEARSRLPRISGIVTDEADRPLLGAAVRAGRSSGKTDRDGRFTLERLREQPDQVELELRAAGFERLEAVPVRWGQVDLAFRMRACLSVEVQVSAETGAPVEDFAVFVIPQPVRWGESDDDKVRSKGHHAGGRAVVTGIRRGPALVWVQPGQRDVAETLPQIVNVADPGPVRVMVRLPRAGERTLRVERRDGMPVAGTTVELADLLGAAPRAALPPGAITSWWYWLDDVRPPVRLLAGATDERGELRLRGPADRPLALFVRGPGHAPTIAADVRLSGDGPLLVTVADGGRLCGRVTPAALVQELRREAGLPEQGPVPGHLRSGDAGWRLPRFTLRRAAGQYHEDWPPAGIGAVLEADGSFAFDGVPPGTWQVRCNVYFTGNHDGHVADVTLREGETTAVDLDLSTWIRGDLIGTVLINGQPLRNADIGVFVRGQDRAGRQWQQTATPGTDGNGTFSVRVRPGRVVVMTRDLRQLRSAEEGPVPAGGSVELSFRMETGKVRVTLLDAGGRPVPDVTLHFLDGTGRKRHESEPTDAQGACELELETEPFTLAVLPRRLQDKEAQREVMRNNRSGHDAFASLRIALGSVTATRDAPVEIEFRLPSGW